MKKRIGWLLGLVTILIAGLTFQVQSVYADDSLAQVKQKGEIVMGTSPDYPPYEFEATENGKTKIVGMDVEIAKQIAKDLGVKLVIKKMSFDSLLTGLQTGKVDMVISGMNPTPPARRKNVSFSDVYYQGGYSILVNKTDSWRYKDKNSFEGKTVGAQTGTTQYVESQKQIKDVKVKGMTSAADLVLALQSHKVNGVAMEKPTAEAYVANNKSLVAVPSHFDLSSSATSSAIAFPKGITL